MKFYAKKLISTLLLKYNEENSLLKYVQKTKQIDKKIQKIINRESPNLWLSKRLIVTIVLLSISFGLLSHIHNLSFYVCIKDFLSYIIPIYPIDNSQNLITIHTGIGALLITLAVLVAQEVFKEKTKEYPYRSFIILKKSHLFPLLVSEIIYFITFLLEPLLGDVNIVIIVPLILISTGTIYSLYKTFTLISDDFELKKAEEKLFFERIQNSFLKTLDSEITKQIGNDLLYQKFKKNEQLINITPYPPIYKEKYIEIKSKNIGFCKDINLDLLEEFLQTIKESAPPVKSIYTEQSIEQNIQKEYERDIPLCYLNPIFFSNLQEANNILFYIRHDLITNENKFIFISY